MEQNLSPRILLIAMALQCPQDREGQLKLLNGSELPADYFIEQAVKVQDNYITCVDSAYPMTLRKMSKSPLVITKEVAAMF